MEKQVVKTWFQSTYPIYTLTPEAYIVWKTSLIHEAAHVYYNHSNQRIAYLAIIPFIIEYGTKYLKFPQMRTQNKFWNLYNSLCLFGCKYGFANIGYLLLSKFQENQADKEVIKRCKDPEMLRAKANQFDAFEKMDKRSYYDQMMDSHRTHHIRSQYFRKAAEKLEQQKKS